MRIQVPPSVGNEARPYLEKGVEKALNPQYHKTKETTKTSHTKPFKTKISLKLHLAADKEPLQI